MDERTVEACGSCMWMIYDREGSCWDYCKGEANPQKNKGKD
jgi:hypothetical protein